MNNNETSESPERQVEELPPQTEVAGETNTPEVETVEAELKTGLADIEQELAACRAQADEYLDQWRRTAAEFANYKKRIEREQAESIRFHNARLITDLLPIIDDLDRAFQNLPEELAGHPWIEGMVLIHRKLHTILEQEGVREIQTVGQKFDPALHEAVTYEFSGELEEGTIMGEVQKGYMLHDRVLRVAQVRVSAGRADKKN